jgi:hypothetical protein
MQASLVCNVSTAVEPATTAATVYVQLEVQGVTHIRYLIEPFPSYCPDSLYIGLFALFVLASLYEYMANTTYANNNKRPVMNTR